MVLYHPGTVIYQLWSQGHAGDGQKVDVTPGRLCFQPHSHIQISTQLSTYGRFQSEVLAFHGHHQNTFWVNGAPWCLVFSHYLNYLYLAG